jgi:uncharacterized membrane protein SirB2
MHPNLSFEQAPPIDVPLRFLLTAPWFGVVAGLLLATGGELAVASRWTPQALAVTHLLVAGYLLQAMSGALFQFVPVAAGGNVWRPRWLAALIHPAYALAVMLLAAGFLTGEGCMLRAAAGLFLPVALLQVAIVGTALLRTPARGPTIAALRLAVIGLGVTVILGATLAEGLAGSHAWPLFEITSVHAAWGLGGWVLMLVLGVSCFVVPMFQLTPQYPVRFALWAPRLLAVALLAWSGQLATASPASFAIVLLAGLAVAAAYAVVTLQLQARRRRQVTDPTFMFFRGAMVCLLSVAALAAAAPYLDAPALVWWIGVLFIGGTAVSLINGMAYKIVPFLCWLHLQRQAGIGGSVPNMREMLGERPQRWQMRLHFTAVGLLASAPAWPPLANLGGAVFAASSAWLGWNLAAALRRYRGFRSRGCAAGAGPGS